MIVLVTTRGNGYTLKSMVAGTYGVPLPVFRTTSYERLFGSWRVPRATYIFADIERLAPWELRLAADLYRSMTAAGLRCLNDPARAMARVELMTALHRAGINPFAVYRADEDPRPARFPVFLRSENDHLKPDAELFHDQAALDRGVDRLRTAGIPVRGMLVVEQASAPYRDRLWAKWGTWQIGDATVVEHIAVDDIWLVKTGDHAKVTESVAADEHDAVVSNRFAPAVAAAFRIAGIEFGRADHAEVGGRTVVYEINTNPYSGPFVPDRNPLRRETQLTARGRIADALAAIDTPQGGRVAIPASVRRRPIRWWRPGFVTPRRP
jgi:hypothetical protein